MKSGSLSEKFDTRLFLFLPWRIKSAVSDERPANEDQQVEERAQNEENENVNLPPSGQNEGAGADGQLFSIGSDSYKVTPLASDDEPQFLWI